MEKSKTESQKIEYIVGTEKGLKDLLSETEVMLLLKGVVKAGAASAVITDAKDRVLWSNGNMQDDSPYIETGPVYLEGELVGRIKVYGEDRSKSYLKNLTGLLLDTINMIIHTNLKRMLTTEAHTTIVNQSYEELLETNRKLSLSEGQYRELAESLERKVQERTEELRRAHARMLQQEKMASVGQLAAGVAHEINNPLGFISSNINTLKRYIERFREMVDFYHALLSGGEIADKVRGLAQQKQKDLKIDFIVSDADELIKQSLDGAERVKKIVSDLKGFSHIDEGEEAVVDINTEIDRTLNVLSHEIPKGAEIIKDYHDLPGFVCNPALICQVFLNIILNALQARTGTLKLVISTDIRHNNIMIKFSDNGKGIPDNIKNRIFEPFYTTKDVGKGTGMGLTVAYEVITAYGGTIEVESQPGEGATFIILLPAKRL